MQERIFPIFFFAFIKVLHLWSKNVESLEPNVFISKVLQWQQTGYVRKYVWNEMDKIVDPKLLPSQQEIDRSLDPVLEIDQYEQDVEKVDTDDSEHQKLDDTDVVTEPVWAWAYQNMHPSKRKAFVLKVLELTENEFSHMNKEIKGAGEKNYRVIFVCINFTLDFFT